MIVRDCTAIDATVMARPAPWLMPLLSSSRIQGRLTVAVAIRWSSLALVSDHNLDGGEFVPSLSLDQPMMWVVACVTALVAGFVRGFSGFGGPAVMTLVLIQFYSPVSVLSKVILIDFVVNLKLLPSTAHEVDRRLASVIIFSSFVGLPLGVYALVELDPTLIKRAIALVAAVASCAMLIGWRFKRVPSLATYVLAGWVSGVVLGATFIALVMVVFLFASPARAAIARANAVYWGFATSVALIVGYSFSGLIVWDDVWRSAIVGVFYLAGAVMGSRVFRVTRETDFRRVVLLLLLTLSGAALLGA